MGWERNIRRVGRLGVVRRWVRRGAGSEAGAKGGRIGEQCGGLGVGAGHTRGRAARGSVGRRRGRSGALTLGRVWGVAVAWVRVQVLWARVVGVREVVGGLGRSVLYLGLG